MDHENSLLLHDPYDLQRTYTVVDVQQDKALVTKAGETTLEKDYHYEGPFSDGGVRKNEEYSSMRAPGSDKSDEPHQADSSGARKYSREELVQITGQGFYGSHKPGNLSSRRKNKAAAKSGRTDNLSQGKFIILLLGRGARSL